MNQVHKETLTSVDNSLPNRQGLEVEIFGMEGIPEDVVQAHNQRMLDPASTPLPSCYSHQSRNYHTVLPSRS
jgi:hypothetical protein